VRSNDAGSGSHRRQRVRPQEGYLGRQRDPLPTRVQGLPPLPDAFTPVLDAGLVELRLPLAPEQRAALADHVRLLLAWTDAINLTAIRDPADLARLHVIDSLTAVPVLAELGIGSIVDLGSGGGFPGVPIAIALPADVLLVESVGKKAAFLRTVADITVPPRLTVAAVRAELLAANPAHRQRWPAVAARAVAPLADLVELAFPLLRVGGVLVAWKRGDVEAEVAAALRAIDALGGGRARIHDPAPGSLPGHRLVLVRKAGRTGDGWPRDPATRRRRPW